MMDCEVAAPLQFDIMKNKLPLPDMTWSIKDINIFIYHPTIHQLMIHNIDYIEIEIDYIERNNLSDDSSV